MDFKLVHKVISPNSAEEAQIFNNRALLEVNGAEEVGSGGSD